MDVDIVFSRALLRQGCVELKRHFPHIHPVKDAWVRHSMKDNWEFHGPDDFYWYCSAGNAYEARYKGWMAWLRSKNINLNVEGGT